MNKLKYKLRTHLHMKRLGSRIVQIGHPVKKVHPEKLEDVLHANLGNSCS